MSFGEGTRALRVIATREIGANFDSGIAYVTTIAFALLSNSIFMNEFFLTGTVDMTGFFDLLPCAPTWRDEGPGAVDNTQHLNKH